MTAAPFGGANPTPDSAEWIACIQAAKQALGPRMVLLGHHYQRDEVIRLCDFRGDSLQLARQAAAHPEAEYIVFCGVHFMAETAAILAQPHQVVMLPALDALCPLAEKADRMQVEDAWKQLAAVMDTERELLPVTYVNSEAELKAFCGEHGGAVCTSSNAREILAWAFPQRKRVFFFPDQYLGRNTGVRMGVPLDQMPLWDPRLDLGGSPAQTWTDARVLLWKGWCYVHQRFRPEQVLAWRARVPGIRVWVHLECEREVVALADEAGSTADIIRLVEAAPAGTQWAVGTEGNLVDRLAQAHPDQQIHLLSPEPNNCITMNKTTLELLARVTDGLLRGEPRHVIRVPEEVARPARVALERMLEASQ
jgi:quinolinate synthase